MRYRKLWFSVALLAQSVWVAGAGAEVEILSRKDWKAQPARDAETITARVEEQMLPRAKAVYLTVHNTGVKARDGRLDQKMQSHQEGMYSYYILSDDKKKRRFIHLRDPPYHFFIDKDGAIAESRELRFAAYSNTEYATPIEEHITVVLEGNFEDKKPTGEQISSLLDLLEKLASEHEIKLENITYHRAVAKHRVNSAGAVQYATSCPGKHLIARFEEIKAELSKRGIQ